MANPLDVLERKHINESAVYIETYGVENDNQWNEYYVEVNTKYYPFKSIIRKAHQLATGKEVNEDEFKSNISNRNKLRDLGYNIRYIRDGIRYDQLRTEGITTEDKIARITWNDKMWTQPSGSEGKSDSESYEKDNGFGHEEWLFTREHQIGDYKYSFLEPIHKYLNTYSGKYYNISLFTRDGNNKQDYWVTTLKDVEILGEEEAKWVFNEYKKRGWYKQMKEDLKDLKLNPDLLDEWLQQGPHALFNIKFKASQSYQLNGLIPIENKKDIPSYRYNLMNIEVAIPEKYTQLSKEQGVFEESGSTDPNISSSTCKRIYTPKEKEIERRHAHIQQEFMKYLQERYEVENVKRECKGYGMSRIDITRKTPDGKYIYYEVKSYVNLLTSLRESIGQLLEYCLYPKVEKAKEIILVSDIDPSKNKELMDYLEHLKNYIHIPFSYIGFDPDAGEIIYQNTKEKH